MSFLEKNKNKRLLCDGRVLLSRLPSGSASACFMDAQYRQIMEKMKFGNEGKSRQKERATLPQMSESMIVEFMRGLAYTLKPGGYLFFWLDKFMLAEGLGRAMVEAANLYLPKADKLHQVDLLTWDKVRMGNGYRTRRRSEFLLILQKTPKSIKTWKDKGIPDVWTESILKPRSNHTHKKPVMLIMRLIEAVTLPGDLIVDPCAGSFITMAACLTAGRDFIGGDISPKYGTESPYPAFVPCPSRAMWTSG